MSVIRQNAPFTTLIYLAMTLCLSPSCGSVAGNPKKPTTPPTTQGIDPTDPSEAPNQATQSAISKMKLPTITFELGDISSDEQNAAFRLREGLEQFDQDEDFKADDTIINGWSSRLEKIIDNMNTVTAAVNKSLDSEAPETTEKKIKLKRKGVDRRLSATIDEIDENGTIRFEASICLGGRLAGHINWNKDKTKIVYTRDLGTKAQNTDDDIPLITQLTVENSSTNVKYTLKTSGSWLANQPLSADGNLFVDATESIRQTSGIVDIKYVADYFSLLPTDQKFEGDSYLVGRLTPTSQKGKSGKYKSQKEFVAYFKGLSQSTCRTGFDETSPTLWLPKANEPRFCLGRPLTANRFKTLAAFYETLGSLKPIGVLSRQTLAVPTFKEGLKCEE